MKKIALLGCLLFAGIAYGADLDWAPVVADQRYYLRVSTIIAGKTLDDGVVVVGFKPTYMRLNCAGVGYTSFASTNILSQSTMYAAPNSTIELLFDMPMGATNSNNFTVDLTAGDTVYYYITGVK